MIIKSFILLMTQLSVHYCPVFAEETGECYNKYKELAKKFDNLILAGRLSEYRYYEYG